MGVTLCEPVVLAVCESAVEGPPSAVFDSMPQALAFSALQLRSTGRPASTIAGRAENERIVGTTATVEDASGVVLEVGAPLYV